MKTQSNYTDAGWNFNDTWEMPTNGYPVLSWQNQKERSTTPTSKVQSTYGSITKPKPTPPMATSATGMFPLVTDMTQAFLFRLQGLMKIFQIGMFLRYEYA